MQYRPHSGAVSQPVPVFVQSPGVPMVPSGYPEGAEYPVFSVPVQTGYAVPVGVSELSAQDPGFSQFGQTGPVMVGSGSPVTVLHEGAGSTKPGPAQAALPGN